LKRRLPLQRRPIDGIGCSAASPSPSRSGGDSDSGKGVAGRDLPQFAAANEPKRLVIIPGGEHNDPPTPAFYAALDEFLGSLK
jgi:hypothetical protein